MPTIQDLQKFLDNNEIIHFKANELVSGLNSGNELPPIELWTNCLPTLHMLDRCRDVVGRIRINSGYRSPEYNAKVGGASKSMHKQFKAFDICPLDNPLEYVCQWLNRSIPKDSWGLRLYETFIHIDCRDWKYRDI